MLNSAIELHDSVVAKISSSNSAVEIALRPAYVHQSTGVPGVDDGIGVVQDVVIAVENGSILGDVGDLPADIFDGEFAVGPRVFPNEIVLPCDIASSRLTLTLFLSPDNRKVIISGTRVSVRLQGQASYVEEFRR